MIFLQKLYSDMKISQNFLNIQYLSQYPDNKIRNTANTWFCLHFPVKNAKLVRENQDVFFPYPHSPDP